jgi:hypothetical protein
MAVMLVISGMVFAQSVQLSGTSNTDDSAKRAFQAAEAGLRVAIYRLNMLQPTSARCITTSVQSPDATNWCAETSPESIGRSQSYTYRVSTPSASGTCAGSTLGIEVEERCIVAVGTVNGVKRRVEVRVASSKGLMFPVPGMLGLDAVDLLGASDKPETNSAIGSNGAISVPALNAVNGPIVLGPVGSVTGVSTTPTRRTTPFSLAPADFLDTATSNSNGRLVTATCGSNCDAKSASVSYDAANRTLAVPANQSVTLGASGGTFTYNFCNVTLADNASLNVAAGAAVKLYIDSPENTGSGCPAGSGTFSSAASGSSTLGNPSQDPRNLQIIVWGTALASPAHLITLPGTTWYAAIYAPRSTVRILVSTDGADFVGGLSAKRVEWTGNGHEPTFVWDSRLLNAAVVVKKIFYRTAWRQCASQNASTDPNAGC